MKLATSKLTAQGQISVPAEVRKLLGLAAGSVIEWDEEGGVVIVRRAGRYSSQDIHAALFPTPPKPKSVQELKEGIRQRMKTRVSKRHARD